MQGITLSSAAISAIDKIKILQKYGEEKITAAQDQKITSHARYEHCLQAAYYYQAAWALAKDNKEEKSAILQQIKNIEQNFSRLAFDPLPATFASVALPDAKQQAVLQDVQLNCLGINPHKKKLLAIRQDVKAKLTSYQESSNIKTTTLSDQKPLTMQSIYQDITCRINKLFTDIIEESIKQYNELTGIKKITCDYTFIALGSLARSEITPYSDIEFGLLIENKDDKANQDNKIYFRNLCRLINFKLLALAETPASAIKIKMPIVDGKLILDPIPKGLCIDACVPGGYKNPLGKRNNKGDIEFELIGTPKELADYQDEKHYSENGKLNGEPFLPGSLVHSCCIVASANQKVNLLQQYHKLVIEKLETPITIKPEMLSGKAYELTLRKKRALKLLYVDLERFQLKLGRQEPGQRLFSVKHDFYRLLNTIIDQLAHYYGNEKLSLWDRVNYFSTEKTDPKTSKIFDEKTSQQLKTAIDTIVEMRLAIYCDADEQIEITEFKGFVEMFEATGDFDEKSILPTPNKKYTLKMKAIFEALKTEFMLHKMAKNFCDNFLDDKWHKGIKVIDDKFAKARILDFLYKKEKALALYSDCLQDEKNDDYQECLVYRAFAYHPVKQRLDSIDDFYTLRSGFNHLSSENLDKQLKFARYIVLFVPLLVEHRFYPEANDSLQKAELIFRNQLGKAHPEYDELLLLQALMNQKMAEDKNVQSSLRHEISEKNAVIEKILKLRQAVLDDKFITDELAYYVEPNGQTAPGIDDISPLASWIKEKLLDGDARVLLLQGEAGAGKSTFNRHLLRQLWDDDAWKNFKAGSAAPDAYLPIFIPLAWSSVNPNKLLNHLDIYIPDSKDKFTKTEIKVIASQYRLLLIADGYDEMPQKESINLYDENNFNDYNGRVKLIISCRMQRVQELNESRVFIPHDKKSDGKEQGVIYKKRYVAAFDKTQITDYLGKYIAKKIKEKEDEKELIVWPDVAIYQKHLKEIPELEKLITTPFLLLIMVQVLPGIVEEIAKLNKDKKDEKGGVDTTLQLTRAKLYDRFVENWFLREKNKLNLASPKQFECPPDIIKNYWQFCLGLAQKLHKLAPATAVQYPFVAISPACGNLDLGEEESKPINSDGLQGPWVEKFFGNKDTNIALARKGSPLRVDTGNWHQFIHASLIDYFLTTSVWKQSKPVIAPEVKDTVKIDVQPPVSPTATKTVTELYSMQLMQNSSESILTGALLTRDQIFFLADRVKQDKEGKDKEDKFENYLWKLVERSKQEPAMAQAAANAITILNAAGVSFASRDLRKINIPGADLSSGILDSTQLQGANMTGVNLQGAWLREANLSGAQLKDINFGELPLLLLKGGCNSIQYSPNGLWLAVASGNEIIVYDAQSRECIQTLTGHKDNVLSVAWDHESKHLASGSDDKTVRIWKASSGKALRVLQGHTRSVSSVAWDHESKRLASGSLDSTVRLWEASSGKALRVLQGHTDSVNSVAWDHESKRLASGSRDKTVRLWEASSGKALRVLQGHTHSVSSVAWDHESKRLASGSWDNTVRLWEASSGKELCVLQGHTRLVTSVAWDHESKRLASGSDDNTVRLWEASSGKALRVLQGHTGSVNSVAWDHESKRLASGSWDSTVRLWEASSGKALRVLQGHTGSVNSVAWDHESKRLASGSDDYTVRLWEASSGKALRVLQGHTRLVNSVAWDHESKRLASGSRDNTVRLWEASSGKTLRVLQGHTGWVSSVAWDHESKRLASGSWDNTVRLWEASSGKALRVLQGHTDWVNSIAWDHESKRLASGSDDNTVRLWEASSGKALRVLQGHTKRVSSVAWDHESKRVASGSYDNTVRLWEASSDKALQLLQGHTDSVNSVAWDHESKYLASGSDDKTVRLWEASSDKALQLLQGHTDSVNSVAWDHESKYLASGSNDKTVRIWKVATGNLLGYLQFPYDVTHCAWAKSTPGQERLAVAFGNGIACFTLSIGNNSFKAELNWLAIPGIPLHASQINITDAIGLSTSNQLLLEQHNAIGKPSVMTNTVLDAKDSKQAVTASQSTSTATAATATAATGTATSSAGNNAHALFAKATPKPPLPPRPPIPPKPQFLSNTGAKK